MCGIVGYVGQRQAASILVDGLKKLEYRGYDSAGIAVVENGALHIVRASGKLKNLQARLSSEQTLGTLGIGHTRWATHGRPSDENAHPHSYRGVAVVHNGILENHLQLKAELRDRGHVFSSETDSEVFAHLISQSLLEGNALEEAVRAAMRRVKGTYGLAVVWAGDPGRVVATKDGPPLVVGLAEGENFVASDVPAFLDATRDVIFLEDGDLASVTASSVEVWDRAGQSIQRTVRRIDWTPVMAEKGGHKHFMHKEIWEQPRAVADTLRGRVLLSEGDVFFEGWSPSPAQALAWSKVTILACGTSWHAGLAGKTMLESLVRMPVEVELASEFRYRNPLVGPDHLVLAISQSGETLDTLAALREAKASGAFTLAICNVMGSAMTREAHASLLTNAGPEIGVASTKAFTTQLATLYLIAVKLGRLRGQLGVAEAQDQLTHLVEIPKHLEEALRLEPEVKRIARLFQGAQDFLFLGRGTMFPVALEGALKLKEVSYIHAEGYAGGEMKHGPIALIDSRMPVVVLAPRDPPLPYQKMLGNVEEVRARGGKVIAVVDQDDTTLDGVADEVLHIPATRALLSPLVATVPLQLLAYHVADLRGNDVDQPRNLAKSVTVE